METAIRVDSAVTTLVNVFSVEPDNQPKVLAFLQEGIADDVLQDAGVDLDHPPAGAGTADQVVVYSAMAGRARISTRSARILG